jgi:hypothetical protein
MKKPFLYKLVVTRVVSVHSTEREARSALKKLKPEKDALGVVIKVPNKTRE